MRILLDYDTLKESSWIEHHLHNSLQIPTTHKIRIFDFSKKANFFTFLDSKKKANYFFFSYLSMLANISIDFLIFVYLPIQLCPY